MREEPLLDEIALLEQFETVALRGDCDPAPQQAWAKTLSDEELLYCVDRGMGFHELGASPDSGRRNFKVFQLVAICEQVHRVRHRAPFVLS
jgi:hypothetical protein